MVRELQFKFVKTAMTAITVLLLAVICAISGIYSVGVYRDARWTAQMLAEHGGAPAFDDMKEEGRDPVEWETDDWYEDDLDGTSIFQNEMTEQQQQAESAFDKWLGQQFVKQYNIEFKYRYALNESDMGYYTVPADVNSSVIYAHLVKYLCIDTYDEIAGVSFTRSYFPKMFFLIGTWEYRNNGSIVLGTAEAGKKIMLAGVNELPLVFQYYEGAELDDYLNTYYIKTIHHEFTHILNQTKDYPVEFTQVTPTTYVTESWSTSNYNTYYRQRGYVSTYAQHSDTEDFAEMVSEFITHNEAWWAEQITNAGEKGRLINAKLDVKVVQVKMYVMIVNQDIISKITNAINALIIVKKPKKIHANVNHAMMGNF